MLCAKFNCDESRQFGERWHTGGHRNACTTEKNDIAVVTSFEQLKRYVRTVRKKSHAMD